MRTPCESILDEPIIVLFWEWDDFRLLFFSPFALQWVMGPGYALCTTVLLAWGAYRLKRGKPSGALLHALHRWELFALPGVLSPCPQRYDGRWGGEGC